MWQRQAHAAAGQGGKRGGQAVVRVGDWLAAGLGRNANMAVVQRWWRHGRRHSGSRPQVKAAGVGTRLNKMWGHLRRELIHFLRDIIPDSVMQGVTRSPTEPALPSRRMHWPTPRLWSRQSM